MISRSSDDEDESSMQVEMKSNLSYKVNSYQENETYVGLEEDASLRKKVEEIETDHTCAPMEALENGNKEEEKKESRWDKVKAFLLKWHLPMMLIFAVVMGYLFPEPGEKANSVYIKGICLTDEICVYNSVGSFLVAAIFIISGMKLKTDAIKGAIAAWKASLYGIIAILFITPCMSFAVVTADFGGVPEFGAGLALFFAMPTTLSSGPILVGQAKGNVALALLLTVVTNVVGIFTAPLFVSANVKVIADSSENVDFTLDPVPLICKLIFTILFPLIVGKLLRNFAAVRNFTKRFGKELKLLSSLMLALIPWMNISASADSFGLVSARSFFLMWLTGIAVHIAYLLINFVAAEYILKLDLSEKSAIVIVASQKTLPVAMTILEMLPNSSDSAYAAKGLVAIPIIVSHLSQIIIDAFVAAKYAAISESLPAKD